MAGDLVDFCNDPEAMVRKKRALGHALRLSQVDEGTEHAQGGPLGSDGTAQALGSSSEMQDEGEVRESMTGSEEGPASGDAHQGEVAAATLGAGITSTAASTAASRAACVPRPGGTAHLPSSKGLASAPFTSQPLPIPNPSSHPPTDAKAPAQAPSAKSGSGVGHLGASGSGGCAKEATIRGLPVQSDENPASAAAAGVHSSPDVDMSAQPGAAAAAVKLLDMLAAGTANWSIDALEALYISLRHEIGEYRHHTDRVAVLANLHDIVEAQVLQPGP